MNYKLYTTRIPMLTIGFHGCDKSVVEKVVAGENFVPSTNSYDWLGHGIYFWENNPDRAMDWAVEQSKRGGDLKAPAVVGAVISLGNCVDLTESASNSILETAYHILQVRLASVGKQMPQNRNIGANTDMLLRELDCAVIETMKELQRMDPSLENIDSVRGIFTEGIPVYPGAGFHTKDHIQICVVNPNCIKGVFVPRKYQEAFPNV